MTEADDRWRTRNPDVNGWIESRHALGEHTPNCPDDCRAAQGPRTTKITNGHTRPIPSDEPPDVTAARQSQADALTRSDTRPGGRTHDERVVGELARLRARTDAKIIFDAERASQSVLPPLLRLDKFLAAPDDPVTYRIAGLWPSGGRIMSAAPKKAGKTTLNGNLMRSLVDGDPFLDRYRVEPMERLILIDNELDERMLRRWLRDHHIQHTNRIHLATLRGRLSTFNILDPATRARWANHLGAADGLIFDCLRPVLDALGLDESREAGRFLEALDELLTEAGIPEALVSHHHGHGDTERARGDSRIVDWPDANWNLVEETPEGEPRRVYFSARGRDVEEPEQLLTFTPDTRHLAIGGGSRAVVKIDELVPTVVDFVITNPGASQNAVEKGVGRNADDVRKALVRAHELGRITRRKTAGRWVHEPTSSGSSDLVPDEQTNPPRHLVSSSLRGDEDEAPSVDPPSTSADQTKTNPTARCDHCGDPLDQPALTAACKPHHHPPKDQPK